jgi:hypothetical protein
VILNTTATGPTKYGWLTLYPTGEPLPTASNLNFVAGQTVPNLVAVKTGPDGRIRVNNSAGLAGGPHVHVILDVVGWYDDGTVGGAGFTPVAPTRIVDTRSYLGGYGKLGPQQTMSCEVTDVGGVPASGVSAVIVNTTVTGATRSGWLTLYPTGEALPTASNLNFVAGQTVPNLAAVKTGPDGEINANNTGGSYAAGWVHVIMDIAGYFDTGV